MNPAITDFEGRDVGFLLDPLHDQSEGTCEELGRGRWLVRGRAGSYLVDVKAGQCCCPHHQHRLSPGEYCRHLKMLRTHLEREGLMSCPFCTEEAEGPCQWCADRGLLPREEYAAALEYTKPSSLRSIDMTEDELKEMFA